MKSVMERRMEGTARIVLALALVLGGARTASGQRDLSDIPPPDVSAELEKFEVAEGFEIAAFAADPLVSKPIQMNFDAAGRLWVASSPIYPQILPGAEATDRVLVLEDTDGDGVADVSHVFTDELLIPTAVIPGDGGAYVANSTELVHLRDTDGDWRADERRVILSGFGTEDTHHILHTLRWGPDGFLYFNQSIYIHSHVETPYGVRRLYAGGIWQFKPETMRLEVFVRGMVNGWGHQFDDWGQQFGADGAYFEGIIFFVPGASYATAYNARRISHGLNPSSPKHCSVELLSGRHLPEDYRGSILACDFRAHRINRFQLVEAGAGYRSVQQPDLVRSRHVAFRPIDVKMGPDGAIYIADWYNPIIQHGEVDFRDERRNHANGRIWRMTVKGRPLVERPRLVDAPIAELVEQLAAPEYWTRHHAKRVLSERPADDVVAALDAWVARVDAAGEATPELEHRLLEALWLRQTIDRPNGQLLTRLLDATEPRARAAAVKVLGHWRDALDDPLAHLARLVEDEFPRVRLDAVRVLAKFPGRRAAELALRALDHPVDSFLDDALWLTANELEAHWLPPLQRGELVFGGDVRKLEYALTALGSAEAARPLRALIASGKVPAANVRGLLELVARVGSGEDQRFVLEQTVAAAVLDDGDRAGLLAALSKASRERDVRPDATTVDLDGLLRSTSEAVRAETLRLAGAWRLEDRRALLVEQATASSQSRRVRQAALDGLVELGGEASAKALDELARSDAARGVRTQAIAALATLDSAAAARHAATILAASEDSGESSALFRALLARNDGAGQLRAALGDTAVPPDVAKVGLRAMQTSRVEAPQLQAYLEAQAGRGVWEERLDDATLAELAADVTRRGNARRGEDVFRRSTLECLRCHAIGGAGGQVGPDLASLGGVAQPDYLLEALVFPNKTVKENYHAMVVATKQGDIVTGIPIAQSERSITLRTAESEDRTIDGDAIASKEVSGSIMPAGLVDSLTRDELIDLARFLAALGKDEGFTVGREPVVRRWSLIDAPPRDLTIQSDERIGEILTTNAELRWVPAYSRVGGELPMQDLVATQKWGYALASFDVDVTRAGKAELVVNGTDGLHAWVDAAPLELGSMTPLELGAGRRRITFRVTLRERRAGLRVELREADGAAAAEMRLVSGR